MYAPFIENQVKQLNSLEEIFQESSCVSENELKQCCMVLRELSPNSSSAIFVKYRRVITIAALLKKTYDSL